ncbi:MAG: response regulator [Lachnospiraceae bacterium]|nr:response regulator [Lachnospiraceae bacterium]
MTRIDKDPDVKQGLLESDGKGLYGEDMDLRKYEGIQESFRGNKTISYIKNEGIIFTCPVFHGSNIKYVLYRLYPEDKLEKYFSEEIYDDLGKICVTTKEGHMIVPFYNCSKEDKAWYDSDTVQDLFASMYLKRDISVTVATSFSTDRGEMIFFESEIPDTDFIVSGFVPKSVATEGIGTTWRLIVWVFGILIVLMIAGTFLLMKALVKAQESDELRVAKAEAEKASKAKGGFLANMSHEIRTPINAVLGMNEMILRETKEDSILNYANDVKTAGTTLLGIINDILDFSKIEAGKIDIIPVDYDLFTVLFNLVNMIRFKANDKGLVVNLDFDPQTPKMLRGDETRIKQVITNILTNAVKYTEKGSITFSVGYEKTGENSILLKVSVKDTGIGIREEDMDKLFSEFDRLEERRNRHIEGTGLGMAITQNLLELMGSKLNVSSVYGEGSEFSFSVSQEFTGEEVLGDYEKNFRSMIKKENYHESFTAPTARVLIVDDNMINLEVFKNLIKKTLVVTETASSGDEALKLMKDNPYDLIFLDHMMPEKDGIETLQEMKAWESSPNQNTPVICLTANAISGSREEYLCAGFDDYLSKPIDPSLLEKMMQIYLPKNKVIINLDETEDETNTNETNTETVIPEDLLSLSDVGIDVKCGLNNTGTVDEYLPILKIFYDSIRESKKELEKLYDENDFKNYTVKTHALKSSAKIVGAISFGEKAKELEFAGKRGDIDYIRAHHEEFLKEYESFIEPLSAVFTDEYDTENNDKPVASEESIKVMYSELKNAADDMEISRIESILDEIKDYRIPEEHKERYKEILSAIDRYDYEAIVELTNSYLHSENPL